MHAARPLPRGRHGLSREDVADSQRSRLQRAVVELVAEHGFGATTVQQIVAAAAVSRQTFYELYPRKEECYEAALAAYVAGIQAAIGPAADRGADAFERLELMLETTLSRLAAEPALTVCLLFEAPDAVVSRRGRSAIRPALSGHLEAALGTEDAFAVHSFAAMTRQLTEEYVADGRFQELVELAPRIVGLVRDHVRSRAHQG